MAPETWPPPPTPAAPNPQKPPGVRRAVGTGLAAAILAYVASRLSEAYMVYWTQSRIMKGSGITPAVPPYPFMHTHVEAAVLLGSLSASSFVLALWVVFTNKALTKGAFKRAPGETLATYLARCSAAADVVFGCFGFTFSLGAFMDVMFGL